MRCFPNKPEQLFPLFSEIAERLRAIPLHRMTQSGWLRSEWGVSDNNRRARYYFITAAGRRQLSDEEQNWAALTGAVAHVLQYT